MTLIELLQELLTIAAAVKVQLQATIEDNAIVCPEGIFLHETELELARLGGTHKVPGFAVSAGGTVPADHIDEEPTYQVNELHTSTDPLVAARDFLCEVVRARACAVIDDRRTAAFTAEWMTQDVSR